MRIMLTIIVAMTMVLSVTVSAKETPQFQKFDSDVQVIDVRSDAEWEEGHHPDALHLPHTLILDGKGFADLDKTKPVVLYCRSGGRAQRAADFLVAQGFQDVKNLGGISDLVITKEKKVETH
jgi:phage shock protein E